MEAQQMQKEYIKGGSFLIEQREAAEVFTPEDLSDEQRMIGDTTREFIDNEVLPQVDAMEKHAWDISRDLIGKAGELGLLGATIPEEYGGLELDQTTGIVVAEMMGRGSGFGVTFGAQTSIGLLPILYFGSEELKNKWIPPIVAGEKITAYCLSEAGSGSDALGAKCNAKLSEDGTEWILNGEKMWITNGGFADLIIVFAKIDGEHFTGFIVEKSFPGVSAASDEHKLGLNGSSTCAIRLDNAEVPVENVLGEIGKGHKIAFNILNMGRFKLGASCTGGAKLAMREAIQYAKERKQFRQPIASFGAIQHKIAEMAIRIFASESMVYRTAGLIDSLVATVDRKDQEAVLSSVEEYAIECSIIKVMASEVVGYVIDEEVQIFGGNGYSKDYPAERHYRDARINRIFEGTNEINRLLISGMLLKRAMKGELPLMKAAQELMAEVMSFPQFEEETDEPLAAERKAVRNAKKAALLVAGAGVQRFRDGIQDQQEVLMLAADIIMQTYAMESAVLRALALEGRGDKAELASDMARVYVSDSIALVDMWAKQALAATLEGDDLRTTLAALRRFTKHTPVNAVALRRGIAERAIELERYPL